MENGGCSFSKLPLELVAMIINFLSYLDAFRLCLVRKDWYRNNLWLRCGSLDLDETNFLYNSARHNFISIGRKTRAQELKRRGKLRFVDFLNRTMPQLVAPVLSRLNFRMCYAAQYQELIDNLIKFAITKRVENLSLDFSDGDPLLILDPPPRSPFSRFDGPSYVLPGTFFEDAKAIKFLNLTCCCLRVFNFTGFLRLTYLCLKQVDVSEDEVINILKSCPVLETLSLLDCRDLPRLHIFLPLLRLKRLIVKGCCPLSLGIELLLPRLVYFEYAGKLVWFCLKQMTHLEEAVFDFPLDTIIPYHSQELKTFLAGFANVKILSISTYALKIHPLEKMEGPSYYQLLFTEHMTMKTRVDPFEIPGIMCFLQNSPLLKTLSIIIILPQRNKFNLFGCDHEYDNESYYEMLEGNEKACMNHLKEVEVHGFTGRDQEIMLLKFILKSSKSISKLTINPWISINPVMYSRAAEEIHHAKIASESIIFTWR